MRLPWIAALLPGWLLLSLLGSAQADTLWELPARQQESAVLQIYGGADYAAIAPLLQAYQGAYPSVRLLYREFGTQELYHRFLAQLPRAPDLVMSSAMDLQFKLVNDGHAQAYRSAQTQALPDWARWRNEIFGITYEPAVMVINSGFLDNETLPSSRAELIDLIRRKGDQVRGRIGTFDIEKVGLGYLVWSHDNLRTASNGRLLESFSLHDARLFNSSAAMLQQVAEGQIVIAYNVLGSYAHAWARQYPVLNVIMPSDYTTVIMRSAFIPRAAENTLDAQRFLDFMLSLQGQQILADQSSLYPIREEVSGETGAQKLRLSNNSPLRPVPLGVSLLVLTDGMKRSLALEEWRDAFGARE
ncbi:ABC transporter substrate-binding protein [Marinobacterium rhizophilum]|uniref:ABC transporter substrate-binding protein n=1 Tax=Marinobacterium rhizophilum TaxID=420402 RepID=A0ABY5HJT8_9GAMM|nr:ABC transporter substrate-binding protein [Marinobacterium rhizophilum]UTW11510.1 ABC transporter substrate-binding protein [Marinobacterium rhizophilum]